MQKAVLSSEVRRGEMPPSVEKLFQLHNTGSLAGPKNSQPPDIIEALPTLLCQCLLMTFDLLYSYIIHDPFAQFTKRQYYTVVKLAPLHSLPNNILFPVTGYRKLIPSKWRTLT